MYECMDCGYEFDNPENESCPKCHSGDIANLLDGIQYHELTIEDLMNYYLEDGMACICNADTKEISIMEE